MCSIRWILISLVFKITSLIAEDGIFVNPITEVQLLENGEIIKSISGLATDCIHRTFDAIRIICTSKYPNKWTFAYNPLNDSSVTFYIDKTRDAKNITDNATFTYESELVFRVRSPFFTQAITCEHFDEYKTKHYNLTTSVTLSRKRKVETLSILITNDKKWLPKIVYPRFGSNENCTIILYIDRTTRKFSCLYNRKFFPGYEDTFGFFPCNDNDECFAMISMDQCQNSVVDSYSCDNMPCKTFPEYTPGVIVCEAGPDPARKTATARAIFPTIENPPTYYMKEDEVNITQVLRVQSSNKGHVIFEHELLYVTCTGASSFFTKGFRFGFQKDDDSIEYVPSNMASETFSEAYYTAKLEVRVNDTRVKRIFCYAPRWNSYKFETVSLPVKIRAIPPPDLYENEFERKEVAKGESVTLECKLEQTDVPPVSFEWLINGSSANPKPLLCQSEYDLSKLSPRLTSVTKKSCHIELNAKWTQTVLSIFDVIETTEYTCTATNKNGVKRLRHIEVRVTKPAESTGISAGYNAGSIIPIVSIVIPLAGLLCLVFSFRTNEKKCRDLNEEEVAEFDKGNEESHESGSYRNPYSLSYNKEFEIPRAAFTIEEGKPGFLGKGAYGCVQKGKCIQGNAVMDVAIKTVLPSIDVVYFKALLSELKLIIYIGSHPNILRIIGACTQQIRFRNLFVLLEFCPNGNLLRFLRQKRKDFQNLVVEESIDSENIPTTDNSFSTAYSTKDLIRYCLDIIHALEFLKRKQVIHGDIAARNILLDQNMRAKLADFGLSRVLLKCENYVKKTKEPLPWRYMAIESLESNTFSFYSDIWAFGVTMWEIFTLGLVPYSSLNHSPDFVSFIANGLRLPKPEFATTEMHEEVLLECWKKKPEKRMSLDKMKTYFYNLSSALQPELEEHYVAL